MSKRESDKDGKRGNAAIVAEARSRFERCEQWESNSRRNYLDDVKFANGDADNGWQWPDNVRKQRDYDQRPCLTVNKIKQHNLSILNDIRMNRPEIKVLPVGGGADKAAAQVYSGVIRHIEYRSNAPTVYGTGAKFQVEGGIGYWRVISEYTGPETMDQELLLRPINDPLMVYLDPNIQQQDGLDAKFGFIFQIMLREDFDEQYPQYKDTVGTSTLGNSARWLTADHILVAEYYRVVMAPDTLMVFDDPRQPGTPMMLRYSKAVEMYGKELAREIRDHEQTRTRAVEDRKVEWFKIAGDQVVEKSTWLGKYIPIIRVVGEEVIVEGELDRKGHTRSMKDPQRMYNYWTSSATEQVALQGKQPWIAPNKAIEGNENQWKSANVINYSVLGYNHIDDEGNAIPAPQRAQPPQMASAYIQGMQVASDELRAASGQFQPTMGEPGNERSGRAVNARQLQGDRSTFHYLDNLAIAIQATGKILIDAIPKYYDTERVIRIRGEDGTESQVTINPNLQAPMQQAPNSASIIFNPGVGEYDVVSEVGPGYATRRQEALYTLESIVTQSPQLMQVVGDLVFRFMNIEGSEEIADRLRRMVPSAALGGPTPEMQQMMAENQNLRALLNQMNADLSQKTLKLEKKDADIRRDAAETVIESYRAETDRVKALFDALSPQEQTALTLQLVRDVLTSPDPTPNMRMIQ